MHNKPLSLQAWVAYLDQVPLPVLRRTVVELALLREREDEIDGRDLAAVILRDPVMTVKVLRYLQAHRSKSQVTDITTIGRAVMMIGTTPFFRHFDKQPVIEDHLTEYPHALTGMMGVISRAHHAAEYAFDWSVCRYDVNTDEVVIAAVLRDLAEILLWRFAPTAMQEICRTLKQDPHLRSVAVQTQTLGFSLLQLQLALVTAWRLPALLHSLMDDAQVDAPRTKCVALAAALARHSANGWNDAALPDDYEAVRRLLGLSPEEVWNHIRRSTLRAAKVWDWYGVPPAAAWLPMQGPVATHPGLLLEPI